MPAVSEKQRRFFGAVMGAKKGKGGVGGKAKDVAHHMSESKIKDFLHKKGEAYTAGFLRKCAEEGVTPDVLTKEAVGDLGLALDTGLAGDVLSRNKGGRYLKDLERAVAYAQASKLSRAGRWVGSPYKTYRGRKALHGAERGGATGATLGALAGGGAGALSGHDVKSRIVNAIRGALGGGAAGGAAGGLLGA